MNRSKIEWTDYTWNPATGCTRGCDYCYARRMAYRLKGRAGYPKDEPFLPTFHPDRLLEPMGLNKPSRIFTCSMGEIFDPKAPQFWLDLIVRIMWESRQHTFQLLTKQPNRIPHATEEYWPENLWLGVSVDGKTNDTDLINELWESEYPHLTFVSFEPLLGPIKELDLSGVQWVIIGAQTGAGAKQPRKEWLEPIISQVSEHDIPLFIKDNLQWVGERPQEFPRR
jgi:protein gp37